MAEHDTSDRASPDCPGSSAPTSDASDALEQSTQPARGTGTRAAHLRDIGCAHWMLSAKGKYDPTGQQLVRGHYSRRKPDSPQFMPPGETFVLIGRDLLSVWGWWRPHPRSGIVAMNGKDGWTCSVFARHGGPLASELVLDAELALALLTLDGTTAAACGPDGMLTYVWRSKVLSANPGYCYKVAGWRKIGTCARGTKDLLHKPFELAAVAA